MPEQPLKLDALSADASALSSIASNPGLLVRVSDEIYGLDPVCDAARLAGLHGRLRGWLSSADEPMSAVGRTLLELVAARQSPVGAKVCSLLKSAPHRFTPAVIRALWEARDLPRGPAEFSAVVGDTEGVAFLTGELVRAGVLTRAGQDDPMFRLTPAGRHALEPIAREVLALELGRFRWPENVRPAGEWAREAGLELYTFDHDGEDGVAVQRCIRTTRPIGPLSVPNLFGVAGPYRSEPEAIDKCQALAVMFGPQWHKPDINARMRRILDDRDTLVSRTAGSEIPWELTLFADNDLLDQFKPVLESACEDAEVVCHIAA